jgi:branched-chain amino acid transport system permease protein
MTLTLSADQPTAPERDAERPKSGRRGPTPLGMVLRISVLVAVFMVVVFLPTNIPDLLSFATQGAIFAVVGLSLNVIIGYTGQLSLGHNGFVGIGAFTAAYAGTVQGVPFALTFVLGALVTALFALGIGVVALRITGLYLSLITLVFGLTLETTLFEVPELTNSGAGQPADLPERFLLDPKQYYWLCLAIVAVAVYFDWRLLRSKVGRALLALKENERVAEAFGVNVTGYKLLAFTFSGLLAGVAGAMFAYFSGSVVGNNFGFSTFLFLTFVLMVVVGGAGSRVGVIIGSAFFGVLDYLLEETPIKPFVIDNVFGLFGEAGVAAEQFAPQFLGALLLILTLIFNPGGIAQQLRPITRWLGGKPFSLHGDDDAGVGAVEGSSVRA